MVRGRTELIMAPHPHHDIGITVQFDSVVVFGKDGGGSLIVILAAPIDRVL